MRVSSYSVEVPVPRDLSVPVSLTGSGLPKNHSDFSSSCDYAESDRLIQFSLSLFSINRIIPTTKKVSKSTFKSMVTPPRDPDSIAQVVLEFKLSLRQLCDR